VPDADRRAELEERYDALVSRTVYCPAPQPHDVGQERLLRSSHGHFSVGARIPPIGSALGLDHSGEVLLEQIDRHHQQNEIL
jgi:hypothetical protein